MRLTESHTGFSVIRPAHGLELYRIVRDEIHRCGTDADLNHIDTSRVQSLYTMFMDESGFNGDVSLWDVSRVFCFDECFFMCCKFNCDLSGWDVSKGESFSKMFWGCKSFNQDLSKWRIKDDGFTNMYGMMHDCPAKKPQVLIDRENGIHTFTASSSSLENHFPILPKSKGIRFLTR